MNMKLHRYPKLVLAAISIAMVFGPASVSLGKLGPIGNSVRPGALFLPLTCSELMPEMAPFLDFFEAVAQTQVTTNRELSRKMFEIVALREKLNEATNRQGQENPVDILIRRTLCFYREQREPYRPIPYDDPALARFLRSSLAELKEQVETAVFDWEFEKLQRREFERQIELNTKVVNQIREQADVDADRAFGRINASARRKVRSP